RRVLGEAEDLAAVDSARGGQDPVALARLVAHPPRPHLRADQLDRARVAQDLEPLQRAQALVGALDQGECHAASTTNTALWPRKPSEFEIPAGLSPVARSGFAAPGPKSRSSPSSGCSSPSVGGTTRACNVAIVAIASPAPAAPSRWPIADLVDETGICPARSP